MSVPGNTAKLGATHKNIQILQCSPPIQGSNQQCAKGPLDDAALGKHFSIMHRSYSQSSMLLKHTANSLMLDRCCMLQKHATRHFKVSQMRALVEDW